MPRPLGSPASFARAGDTLRIGIPLPAAVPLHDPYFFPATEGALDHAAVQTISRTGDMVVIETRAGPDKVGAITD